MTDKIPHTHAQLKQETADKLAQGKPPIVPPPYTPQQMKAVDGAIGIVQLVSGVTAKGEDFYAYVKVRPSVYEEFIKKLASGETLNIESYGKVLKKGFGKQPDDEVKKYMEEKFGVDHNFMQHIGEELQKLQAKKEPKK